MKKTNAIQLVLITAAMAACNSPLYQQRAEGYEDPGYSADAPDSTNSCPVESSCLPPDYYDWYNGPGAFGSFSLSFNINGYYAFQNPPPPVRVSPIRSLFTRTFASIAAAHATMSHPSAPRPMANHTAVARSGFGARMGSAAHS